MAFPKKKICLMFLFAITARCLFAGGMEEKTGEAASGADIIASTSWVAAIADAAGGRDIRVLAPADLRHPPEYELKPSDLQAVSRASVIVYGGWEMFAQKLAETAGGAGIQVIKVHTANSPDNLKAEAGRLAGLFGTTPQYEAWKRRFDLLLEDLRAKIQNAGPAYRAVVHRAQLPFARWAGLEIAAEYGPSELSPAEILRLVHTRPLLVVDNYHGPVARAVAEASGARYVELLNFPGKDGTKTLEDMFRYNTEVLLAAARK
jgi:ABC-type Zn uptake system ZnuABC Zn-binding protein ZnuA